jgi:hypothetical protein
MEPFTAVFMEQDGWVVGWVEEVPGAVAQERDIETARVSLKAALADVLAANREMAREEERGHRVVREPMSFSA